MDNTTVWLDKIQHTCRQFSQSHVDIIIDQCGMDISVIPALSGFSPALAWSSLYEGLPEDIYREDAPLLVRIDLDELQQVQWMYELAREVSLKAPLLVIVSPWSFSLLADWLRQCVDVSHEGRDGIFRFWDTQNFPWLFSCILDEQGKAQLQRPVLFWSWLNRDEQPAMQTGNGAIPANDVFQKITFSDDQFEALMCLSDAKKLLSDHTFPADLFLTKEDAFSTCFNAMLAATKERILFEDQRNDWVVERLCGQKKGHRGKE